MKIAITGANGQLGSLIMERLLLRVHGETLVACVRNPESIKHTALDGAEMRFCDYDRPESLEPALEGVSALLLISSPHPEDPVRMRQHAHIIEAARKARVGHLLYTSFAFAERGSIPLTHLHMATEHAIMASGIAHTFLRCGLYMDVVKSFELHTAIAEGELRIAPGQWAFNAVTRQELAEAIAGVLADPEAHLHKSYELASPYIWTFDDLADALAELSGSRVVVKQDPHIRHWIYGFLSRIDCAAASRDLERLLGRPIGPLKDRLAPFLTRP
ncbi:MAG: NmrA family protein [Paenibacillus sp.]|nr:NmrA family protein [Paenibacillus sp.]